MASNSLASALNQEPQVSDLRLCGFEQLRQTLHSTWERTSKLLDQFTAVLGAECEVPYKKTLNPPLWEIGHFNWFYEWFITRNPEWAKGLAGNYDAPRTLSRLPNCDHLLDSSAIGHEPRWEKLLPSRDAVLAFQKAVHRDVLDCLRKAESMSQAPDANRDELTYFFKLCVMHEQMHNEAAVFMASQLGIPLCPEAANPRQVQFNETPTRSLAIPAQSWTLGWNGPGFAFDNELPAQTTELAAFEIDSHAVTWQQYLEFADATGRDLPPGFSWKEGRLSEQAFGATRCVKLTEPASHLTWHDANAYCQFYNRRLPTEAEWESSAITNPELQWGWVWEWTCSEFVGFDGFIAHPYSAYSEPWFNDRKVLKGASWATAAGMTHPKYRNFFQPERNDVLSGFRTCRSQ